MAMFCSMMVQIEESRSSLFCVKVLVCQQPSKEGGQAVEERGGTKKKKNVQVVSGVFVENVKVCILKILVIVVKKPRANMSTTATFCVLRRCDMKIGYMGSANIKMSVLMLNPALAYQLIVMSTQVPGMDLSQARGTGVHCQTEAPKVAIM